MIKINHECVSKCLLRCLEQTELKYGEALAHSGGLTKHTCDVENLRNENKTKNHFFFCQKFFITPFTDYLLQNATVGSWV